MKSITLLITSLLLFFISSAQPKGLKVGDKAPGFSVKSHDGKIIKLRNELKKGPVVLFFYRGSWCPYCNKQMAQIQDSLKFISAKGASVIGITPETDSSMNTIVKKSGATFPLLHDNNYHIMNSYGVSFKVDTATLTKYKKYNIHIDQSNGNMDNILPVPATYIIGRDGKINFVYFNPDYRYRVSVAEILTHL